MVRRVSRRLGIAVALTLGGLLALVTGTAAQAVPHAPATPKAPASVTISGGGLGKPLTIHADQDATLYATVMEQVNWLNGSGQTGALQAADLGPKYTVVVLAGDVPKQTYDLYPLAKGGPRACRPAKQPDKAKNSSRAAWFYGRLSMPESLRAAGAPLSEQGDPVSGGIGGGEREVPDRSGAVDPTKDIDQYFGDLRRVLLLNGAVLIVITLGLAGISLLVRRRTR